VGTRGAWAPVWRLGTPPAHTWRLAFVSVLGTSQRTRGAWAPASVLGIPCSHVAIGLLPVGLALPNAHVVLELHWVGDK